MDGLVYTVESEDMGYVQNVSVIRMIPAGLMTIPAEVADFPGRWQQWQLKDRVDRLNDEKEECKEMDHKEMEEEMTEHQVVRSRQADPLLHDSGMQPPPVRLTGTTPFFDHTIERKPQANPFQGRHSMEQAQAGAQRLIEQTSQNFARQGQTIATPTHHTQAPTPSTATTQTNTATTQTNTATTQTPNTTMRNSFYTTYLTEHAALPFQLSIEGTSITPLRPVLVMSQASEPIRSVVHQVDRRSYTWDADTRK